MKRSQLNLAVDVTAFVAFLFLASTGVLLRFKLPPGSGSLTGRGGGFGEGQRVVLTLWGWTRHEWGEIHLWVACGLLAILAVHLFLHGQWIICAIRGKSTDRSGLRVGLGAFSLLALAMLACAPLMSPVAHPTRNELRGSTNTATHIDSPDKSPQNER